MKNNIYISYFKVLICIIFVTVMIFLFCFLGNVVGVSKSEKTKMQSEIKDYKTIVIDAGHGGIDGGAVSIDGTLEKDLNLEIANKVAYLLRLSDLNVVLTRNEDRLLFDDSNSSSKKAQDVRNRVKLTQECKSPVFVSIHQNKFPVSKYSGLQVYYSKNNDDSKIFAENIQSFVKENLQKNNSRQVKGAGSGIYVLNNLNCPSVLVECGFLSNPEETRLLCDENYQKKIAFCIFCAIMNSLVIENS